MSEGGRFMIFKRITFEYVMYEWLEGRKGNIKESSFNKYMFCIEKYLDPYLGDSEFKKIKEKNIFNFYEEDEINKLSNSTKNILLIIIQSCISYGIEKKYRKNSLELDIKFQKKRNEITYFTQKEQNIIEEHINNNMNIRNLAVLFSLYTGVRIGELCALKGTDIDFINNTISIDKTVLRVKNPEGKPKTKLIIGKPKTKTSIRIIPAPAFIINHLKKYIKDKNDFIFTGNDKPKDPRTLEKYFSELLDRLNIKQINFHSLRHTFATRLREQKVDIKVISELLGHSSWKFTQDIYVHASFESKKNSINILGKSRKKSS